MDKVKLAFLRKLFKFLTAFFCGGVATVSAQEPPTNILFIGNSFTHMNSMPVMFEKLAISKNNNVNVVMSAKSNHTFHMHSERADLYEDIKKAKWDYVILQGFSRELSYGNEHIDTAVIPYFQRIVDTLKVNNPCVKLLLYMTWGYENGYAYMNEIGTFEEMSASIESGYRYLGQLYNMPIVPVGNVWKEVRKEYPDFGLYQKDEHHPTKIGSYIVASTFYTAIFHASPEGGYAAGIPENIAQPIQKTAYNYVKNHYKENQLDVDVLDLSYKFTKDDRYELVCKANFPNAKLIQWDFGDGVTADGEASIKHNYKKFGNYLVKLTLEDSCGVKTLYRNISFKEPYQPKAPQLSTPQTNTGSTIKKRI